MKMHRKHKKRGKTVSGHEALQSLLTKFTEPLLRLYAVCTIFAFATEDHSKTSPSQQPTPEIQAQRKMSQRENCVSLLVDPPDEFQLPFLSLLPLGDEHWEYPLSLWATALELGFNTHPFQTSIICLHPYKTYLHLRCYLVLPLGMVPILSLWPLL